MRIVEVRDEAGLAKLKTSWEKLLARSASATIFLTWEWATAWWTAYGRPGDLRILLAMDEEDTLRGIAPLQRRTLRKYGWTFPVLSFLGDGSNDSDYLDFVAGTGDEAPVMTEFCKYLEKELSDGTLLQLNEIPETSPNLPFLRTLGQGRGMLSSEEDVPCATVSLPATWEDYLKKLPPRFRTKIRSVLRNLDARSDVKFQFCDDPAQLDRLLPDLYELHRRRWAKEAKPGVFQGEEKRLFYRTLSPLLFWRGSLCFSWLEWKGQILACQYGFTYQNRYFQLQEGYNPACEHWNVGAGLRAWSIREFLKKGLCEYDFMAGVGRHKSDWGASTKLSKRIVLARREAKNIVLCQGPQWLFQARQYVKRWTPEQFLARRDARQEHRRVAEFERREIGRQSASSVAPWIRGALASGYFHSPLPAVLIPLRNRYQLSVSRNGGGPKIGWRKRREPSARILYFHRVNDEADPFFPAISPALFEQEMRFLARHYHVVSLGEVARRLSQGGPPEPVVAITFDDGYQDNYLNAFPILQRYGLPATIFLTTGGIDSREPLWFEKLALALKKTPKTSIDLEIDLPRRMWMRTEAERLEANAQIFAFLRSLPDGERRQSLAEILAQLGGCDEGERNEKMLTWNQVRLMKKDRIDFGGHTVTHPFVSRLMPEQASWEISECKRRIEYELQAPVEHFAYPNGREEDFAGWSKKVIQEAGYQTAVSTLWGVNYPTTDRMELRRGGPWEERAAQFAAKLDWYQWVDG